ncbi:unnamed protein product [Microthlaspi erraticum]|uniref:At1g61320/AtMIF1 LRR domain-containing protein n=1 Tax=Microthlaspi erraticum TaxID=1685480 RepID=A0A6D2IXP8_9BRAS|nr:unnamed protein product [Microthlaspi erraticum]
MSESSNKEMKRTEYLPEEVVEYMMSHFLPIQSLLRNRTVAKKFKDMEVLSRDLDFSRIHSVKRSQSEAIDIIESVFNQHKGSEIDRFVLPLDPTGVEDKVIQWINTCLAKNIEELVLDFSRSKKVLEIPIEFSAIETLRVLSLKWCTFQIPDNSPKGLKLLRTLELKKTNVTQEMVDAVFNNCIYIASLELANCQMEGILSINAQNRKKFKSLAVYSMPKINNIILNAPTLECYMYHGFVRVIDFSRVDSLKEAKLHFTKSKSRKSPLSGGWSNHHSFDMLLTNMKVYSKLHVLATTHIFLQAFTSIGPYEEMREPTYCFRNLQELQIYFRSLYDIAGFLDHCPNLKRVLININGFTFEPETDGAWESYNEQRKYIENHNFEMDSIREVEINGYRGLWGELEIVRFFAWNARFLKELKLVTPRKRKVKLGKFDRMRIDNIEILSLRKGLITVVESHQVAPKPE